MRAKFIIIMATKSKGHQGWRSREGLWAVLRELISNERHLGNRIAIGVGHKSFLEVIQIYCTFTLQLCLALSSVQCRLGSCPLPGIFKSLTVNPTLLGDHVQDKL